MYRPGTKRRAVRAVALATALGAFLGGCSDIYLARRDTLALSAGDAVDANAAMQTIDPWPPYSGDVRLVANGQKMQSAVERYRTNKVIVPVNPTTSDVENHQMQAPAAAAPVGIASSGAVVPAAAAAAQ